MHERQGVDRLPIHTTARAVVVAMLAALVLPWLFTRGMFWDGVLWATAARNLAQGFDDPWHLAVTGTFMRHLYEHPPLAFWIEAAWFRVLGDHVWVERIHGLAAGLVTLWLLAAIWRRLVHDCHAALECFWLPIAMWAPWGVWSYRHNMLENTLGVFTALSVYASLRAIESRRAGGAGWSALAGLAVAAAVLSKGPVGLFPLVVPAVAWIALRRSTPLHAAAAQLTLLVVCSLALGLMLVHASSREYLTTYWHQQVVSSLLGRRETTTSLAGQFGIVLWLAKELAIPVMVAGVTIVASRLATGRFARIDALRGPFWFCLSMALAASLPLAGSPKQAGHYAAPSWPFYAFAVALWCLPAVIGALPWLERVTPAWRHGAIRLGSAGVVVGAVVLAAVNYDRTLRDHAVIAAADQLATGLSPGDTIAVTSESWRKLKGDDQLKLHAYLYRYHRVSVFVDEVRPVRGLEIHRLERPEPEMVLSSRRVATDLGLVGYLLVDRRDPRVAGAPRTSRTSR